MEGGFRVPAMIKWPGKCRPAKVENGIMSGSTGSRHCVAPPATRTSPTS
jgi:hypothetical protein